jgi:outer membrane protein assembly factor BamB
MGRALLKPLLAYTLTAFLVLAHTTRADDWPEWRGPNRTGVSAEKNLLAQWPAGGPKLLWSVADLGVGYSGPAVVGDTLYVMGTRGDTEYLLALDVSSGKESWALPIGHVFTFPGNSWGDGPRGTPTVVDNRVYALGGQGVLIAADARSGRSVWRMDLPKNLDGVISSVGGGPEKIGWGYCESPLIDGRLLVCTPGGPEGTMAALDKDTGAIVWRSRGLTDPATYSSIVQASIDGKKQYIQMTDQGPVGVDAATGQVAWRYVRKPRYPGFVIDTPVVDGNLVYATAAEGAGCDLIRIDVEGGACRPKKVYSNKTMANQHGGVVRIGDHIFGYSEGKGWVCQDLKSGKLIWNEKRKLGRGSIIGLVEHLICHSEDDGTTALCQASPKDWQELGRLKPPRESTKRKPNGKVWTHPVVANGRLYLRDQELLFCYDIHG